MFVRVVGVDGTKKGPRVLGVVREEGSDRRRMLCGHGGRVAVAHAPIESQER